MEGSGLFDPGCGQGLSDRQKLIESYCNRKFNSKALFNMHAKSNIRIHNTNFSKLKILCY